MNTPLYNALRALARENNLQFHMPAHLGGRGLADFGDGLLSLDVTELDETDNLHAPVGVIREAERLAAKAFGAKATRFLVGGSSAGVLSMVGAVCGEGDKIIADRAAHKSFISALIFSGAFPVWVYPEALAGGLWGGVDPADIRRAIGENPDAKAVFITSPNYFGLCSDVKAIADMTREAGMALLVDAAHGAHFAFCDRLPPSPVALGADMAVMSAHKTLPALTQAAFLHVNRDCERLERLLAMYQSSSPSYLLMASLDIAREIMQTRGQALWGRVLDDIADLFPGSGETRGRFSPYKDASRLVLATKINPYDAARALGGQYKIKVECCWGGGVVCIASAFHTREDFAILKKALAEINAAPRPFEPPNLAPQKTEQAVSPRQAFFGRTRKETWENAIGGICARTVFAYPPAIAQIAAGERVSARAASHIRRIENAGGAIEGYCLLLDEK